MSEDGKQAAIKEATYEPSISLRVPQIYMDAMNDLIAQGAHSTISELVRAALGVYLAERSEKVARLNIILTGFIEALRSEGMLKEES